MLMKPKFNLATAGAHVGARGWDRTCFWLARLRNYFLLVLASSIMPTWTPLRRPK